MDKIINGITEVTNGHFRDLEYDIDGVPYFTYKGCIYNLDEVMRASDGCRHDGYIGFTYFSGLYIDLSDSGDMVLITYFHQ